ncbi:MAG: hypothetical protein DSM107014_14400 [Gomphosphaeria aponina SAG 52.96 = DSM 107014]|uniref:Uncharacterized protein n=1 Tax=Gomphosphaeria aponina SAG 52.96 = DSM 107014 TaxID=1521640 RepID=A0A941GTK5_9CHRO|nr:hypothetical protein [Gomphosphaeria aponina SAG 52.96 = DSM 107014]
MIITNLISHFSAQETLAIMQNQLLPAVTVLAQNFGDNKDLFTEVQEAFNKFVESGQVWAMLIGMFFGYMFRSILG